MSNTPSKADKFMDVDMPKILNAIQDGHKRGEPCAVIVQFAENGGVIAVNLEAKKKYK